MTATGSPAPLHRAIRRPGSAVAAAVLLVCLALGLGGCRRLPTVRTAGTPSAARAPGPAAIPAGNTEPGWWLAVAIDSQGAPHPVASAAITPAAGGRVALPADVLFEFDSAVITADGERDLADLARALTAAADPVVPAMPLVPAAPAGPAVIVGHTDALGSEAYNQALGLARATAVRDHLVADGVAAGRLAPAESMGETCPVRSNDTAQGRAANRRVEILFDPGAPRCAHPLGS